MSNDHDDDIAKAMAAGEDAPKPAASTPKASLRTPPLVAEKEAPITAKPRESEAEMELRLKGKILMDLIQAQATSKSALKDVEKKEKALRGDEDEEPMRFTVNLPPQAQNIRVDGMEYYHGHTYLIAPLQWKSMQDIMARSWLHYRQVRGDAEYAAGFKTGEQAISAAGQ